MQNGKKLWYFTIYDVICAPKYDLQISFKKWFRIESKKFNLLSKLEFFLFNYQFKSENHYTTSRYTCARCLVHLCLEYVYSVSQPFEWKTPWKNTELDTRYTSTSYPVSTEYSHRQAYSSWHYQSVTIFSVTRQNRIFLACAILHYTMQCYAMRCNIIIFLYLYWESTIHDKFNKGGN